LNGKHRNTSYTFQKFDLSKKKQIFNTNPRTPDKTEKKQICSEKKTAQQSSGKTDE